MKGPSIYVSPVVTVLGHAPVGVLQVVARALSRPVPEVGNVGDSRALCRWFTSGFRIVES